MTNWNRTRYQSDKKDDIDQAAVPRLFISTNLRSKPISIKSKTRLVLLKISYKPRLITFLYFLVRSIFCHRGLVKVRCSCFYILFNRIFRLYIKWEGLLKRSIIVREHRSFCLINIQDLMLLSLQMKSVKKKYNLFCKHRCLAYEAKA